jgi:hypothetical protein
MFHPIKPMCNQSNTLSMVQTMTIKYKREGEGGWEGKGNAYMISLKKFKKKHLKKKDELYILTRKTSVSN